MKKKIRLSNTPVTLALIIIFIFVLPASVIYSLYSHHRLVQGMKAMEARYIREFKASRRLEMTAKINICEGRRREAENRRERSIPSVLEKEEVQNEVLESFRQLNTDVHTSWFILDGQMNLLTVPGGPTASAVAGKPGPELKAALQRIDPVALNATGGFILFRQEATEAAGHESVPMLLFARHYAPWNWTIGVVSDLRAPQAYAREQYRQVEQALVEEMGLLALFLALSTIFVFVIGKVYGRRLETNLADFETFFTKAGNANERIDLEKVRFKELASLGKLANTMVAERVRNEKTIRDANLRLKQMAEVDGLTQVANRRFFDDALKKEWARAARERRPITIGMVDIDQFKAFNDSYGHQAGDDCLRQVAGALKEAVRRPADMLARYGGEEFVVLLPDTTLSGATEVATMMQENVAALGIAHDATSAGRVSFSMGMACMAAKPHIDPAILIRRADGALYAAKEAGRDRVEFAPGEKDCPDK